MTEQPGDEKPVPFSHFTQKDSWRKKLSQISCWLTYTNPQAHKYVQDNLESSSINAGDPAGKSPRYCPSIEEKNQIFLEPEGRGTDEVYLNGLYTGLPFDAQRKMINAVSGLENAKIIRYGYAIEYDFSDPLQIKQSLETKNVENLYLAGQINGTTGYEEAAAQGFMAGVNAALRLQGGQPLVLGRQEAYTGVLIDDITTKGTDEPYRMFTSRAEFRLSIRNDNADLRLIDIGRSLGLISDEAYKRFELYRKTFTDIFEGREENLPSDDLLTPWTIEQAREEASIHKKYEGYIEIHNKTARKVKKNEDRMIPENFDYSLLSSLSAETKERLSAVRPRTLGQASRIQGIKPSDIAVLTVYLEKRRRAKNEK